MGIYSTDLRPIARVTVPVKAEKAVIMSICFKDLSNESSTYGPIGTTSLIAVTSTDAHIHIYAYVKNKL